MKNATKGALAAAAAGSLLLGGAGSLAYWTDTGTVDGKAITSGHLKLVQGTCDSAWQLNGTAAYTSQVLAPGDTLTRHCSYTVSKSGSTLTAKLGISTPGFASGGSDTLKGDMNVAGTFTYDADGAGTGTPVAVSGPVTDIADGALVDVTVTATFKNAGAVDNAANTGTDLTATLDATTVTLTQTAPDHA